MARELRDITTNHEGEPDLAFLQRKIAAAGEMKTAIRRLLDEAKPNLYSVGGGPASSVSRKRLNELRKAMEDYLNVA